MLIFIALTICKHHFANLAQRKAAAVEAETIVARNQRILWRGCEHKAPAKPFCEYRGQAEQVRDELTAKALAERLEQGGDAQAIMQDLA